MEIALIFISLLLIAFFSGIEIAFVSANKLRIELLKEKGSGQANIMAKFNKSPSEFISTMLIGLNISLVVFGSITSTWLVYENFSFMPQAEFPLLLVQTVVTTFLILILGEFIPKMIFQINSDRALLLFAYPAKLFYIVLTPLNFIFHSLSRFLITQVFRKQMPENLYAFSKEDLEYLVKETAISEPGEEEEADHLNSEMFEKALYLKEVRVRQCMVPRTEIHAMDETEPISELSKMFLETKLSRILIYRDNIDQIQGYVHHFDLLKKPATIQQAIRPLPVIPESMTARDLLLQFIRERKNIAWVVDEYGGTAGIITLEDLMEQIFGEIEDEHDEENLTEKKVSDNEFIFSGRLEVDYLNREYELDLPEGEYTTLSGYIIQECEDIPEPGTEFTAGSYRFKILRATDTRIELVNIKTGIGQPAL